MADPRGSRADDPCSSGVLNSADTKSETGETRTYYRRTLSEGKISGGHEIDFIEDLRTQLQEQIAAKTELESQVTRLKTANAELQKNLDTCTAEDGKKYEMIQHLDYMLNMERSRREEDAAHYNSVTQDKNVQFRELQRRYEVDMIAQHRQLEEHSKIAQNLAQLREKEHRDWRMEKDNLQSELDGTRQLLHEQEIETGRRYRELEEARDGGTKLEEELEELTVKYDALLAEKQDGEQSLILDVEFQEKEKELTELRAQLTQVTSLIEENHKTTELALRELRHRLAKANNDRDRLTAELHALKEVDPSQRLVQDPTYPSSSENVVSLREKCTRLEEELRQVKIELNEEKDATQTAQERLEDQLRVVRRLEADNDTLRSTIDATTKPQFHQVTSDFSMVMHRNLLELQDTMKAAQSQTQSIVVKKRSSKNTHHVSNLNISLQEAQHQVEALIISIEDFMGIQRSPNETEPCKMDPPQRRLLKDCLHFKSIFRTSSANSSSSSAAFGSRRNKLENNQKLKKEIEDRRKECISLLYENFTLEQCIRYLSARCQLYQTVHFARESRFRHNLTDRGFHSHPSRLLSRAQSHQGVSSSEPVGEIQVDPLPSTSEGVGIRPRGLGQDQEASSSSSSADQQQTLEESPSASSSLTRSLELRLLNKISTICEPFSQLTELPLLLSGGTLHISSQTAASIVR
eukprot:g3235.t1